MNFRALIITNFFGFHLLLIGFWFDLVSFDRVERCRQTRQFQHGRVRRRLCSGIDHPHHSAESRPRHLHLEPSSRPYLQVIQSKVEHS